MKWKSFHQFGHDALGPIINLFLIRLHAHLGLCGGKDHKILFALRAGLRIADLYQTWGTARGARMPANMALLKASRLMAIKAAHGTAPILSATALGQEMDGATLNQIIRCILNRDIASGRLKAPAEVAQMPLHEFLATDDPVAQVVRRYLKRQSATYEKYLRHLAGGAERLILVDSGWRGSTQLLLEAAFPRHQWEGVYFGCIGRAEILGHRPGPMHGLLFDSERFLPEHPETAFVAHRHLVESLFEPGIPSIEQIEAGDVGATPWIGDPITAESTAAGWDEAYAGVKTYVASHAADGLASAMAAHGAAIERLADMLCHPTRSDVPYASGKMRSHDMGRTGEWPPVFPAKDRFPGDNAELRMQQAIWPCGQAALEFPAGQSRPWQDKLLQRYRGKSDESYFVAPTDAPQATTEPRPAHVAIITRTKNRPLLLKRAAESVAAQTHEHYSWVVVNDGGDLDDVRRVIRDSRVDPTRVILCHHPLSLGMEAASNAGIRAAASNYVVIHDDDDSWQPDFLLETVGFLERNRRVYGGVITGTQYISEEIRGQEVIEHERKPYNDWVVNVQLAEMVTGNFFAPIAFVFRRDIWEAVGGYDENLPVLGDWDFNLRFLLRADIGVLPRALACYHHRDRGGGASHYANSVIGGIDRHAAYNAIVRNKYIRAAATSDEYAALAVLMGTAFSGGDLRHRLDALTHRVAALPPQANPLQPQVEALQAQTQDLQGRMDRRWVMLHAAAAAFVDIRKLGITAGEFIAHMTHSIDSLVSKAKLEAPPDFDGDEYLRLYPDVAEAIARGDSFGAFDHYIKHGHKEGRQRPAKAA